MYSVNQADPKLQGRLFPIWHVVATGRVNIQAHQSLLVGQSSVMRSASSAGGCLFVVVVDVNTSLGSCTIMDQTQICAIHEVIIFMLMVK